MHADKFTSGPLSDICYVLRSDDASSNGFSFHWMVTRMFDRLINRSNMYAHHKYGKMLTNLYRIRGPNYAGLFQATTR